MSLTVVILAAGQGTRMRSSIPKVLQPLAGEPLLAHVLDATRSLDPDQTIVVHGHGAELVRDQFADQAVTWVLQQEQLGTGHAVDQAMSKIADKDLVLVLYGDVPLVTPATLHRLIDAAHDDALSLLTVELEDPTGYGRIVRDANDNIRRIVEQKDASEAERDITETNTGLLAVSARRLRGWLSSLDNANAQGEYYLTDIIGMAATENVTINGVKANDPGEVHGINDRRQLAQAERLLRERRTGQLLDSGVTLSDPERVDIRGRVTCGRDVRIDVNVVFEGDVRLGDNVTVGPHCVIRNTSIAAGTRIDAFSHIEDAVVGENCRIGPYARLRPAANLADGVHIGNFVEIKKSDIGDDSKVNHLSYVGDTTIGRNANIGAGTITCNYDGVNKHRTIIGDDAFIGSNTSLVAPVTIGEGATIGAGSTISKDAPAVQLTVSRARQATIPGWKRPEKK